MSDSYSLLILPGDGIGPEVMAEVVKVVDWFKANRGMQFEVSHDVVGGAAYDKYGAPLADSTMELAQSVDAVLLGAVGGPQYDNLDFALKPERGLLRLRKEMDLFANLRPAQCFDALADFSSLKRDVVAGLDILIVRELTSGIYFGQPRGIHADDNSDNEGGRVGINTQRYTSGEIRRVARSAFELARKRDNRVCSMEKANVMESGILWREEVQWVHDNEYPDVELSHMYADNGAMQLVRNPQQFDVIVTDNLFGDILSDAAAMLTGSLGMLPSASLGAPMANGRPKAMYEPVHGSAPDIAGQGKANPIACILSFAMALRYSFAEIEAATALEAAVEKVLADGVRTADLMGAEGGTPVSTSQMGDLIVAALSQGN
ncbi:3-isopropylmalate dehydrogenase [Paracoccus sp. 1_MG-2023]|uniref:3-isopropylmalate dehydrogenase n=1 Tax=unclassified Paracoccus (in: a-proteobacteria) TaxID=2688777 RepID=UPI001C09A674|nr:MULTISPECIES: 3-isopropylmalate dehydrogenase [unclassified Paracoccus (in: a-proteobacteria)]MBU2957174.1 3-isopropylmalate dehydrogenase [Paracoccus sp. C2R09]MDO6669061.1 3-isopropylmalate dehydrogenase [Paracoccus sp. 1_MG-2023]